MKMPKTVRTADLSGRLAAKLFESLNSRKVIYYANDPFDLTNLLGVIVTDVEPEDLIYPDGWYFAKGHFRNKHNSSTGVYEEIPVIRRNGMYWQ